MSCDFVSVRINDWFPSSYRFITLAGFHTNNFSMFDLAMNYRDHGMSAYSELQEKEFAAEKYKINSGSL